MKTFSRFTSALPPEKHQKSGSRTEMSIKMYKAGFSSIFASHKSKNKFNLKQVFGNKIFHHAVDAFRYAETPPGNEEGTG